MTKFKGFKKAKNSKRKDNLMLKNKVILIAGANGRIGSALCRAVLAQNGLPILADLSENAEFKQNLQSEFKQDLLFVKMNICDKNSLQSAINTAFKRHGKIDGFVNSAYPTGKSHEQKPYYELEFDEICDSLNAHLGGFILAAQEFVKFFKHQGHGNIVNLSSIMGVYAPKFENYKGTAMQSSLEYSVIKAGINHLGRWLAKELFGSGIRVNTLASGGILDAQPESFLRAYKNCCASKGMLDGLDICGAICFLLSDLSAFITGQVLLVDDGWGL